MEFANLLASKASLFEFNPMKATDSQQVQAKAPVSSDSAFDQEVGGKTMAPPKFGLEASGGEAAHAADGGGQMPDDEFEALFWKIVEKAKETGSDNYLSNAANLVIQNYGWNEDIIRIQIAEKTKGTWGETIGRPGKGEIQTILLPKKLFKQDFGLIVRTIGHEYQHALNATGDNPPVKSHDDEFRAYYWEITNTDVIAHGEIATISRLPFTMLREPTSLNTGNLGKVSSSVQ
ncbi:MAG: hypothetical protein IPP17_26285 [Bacteroidetes bacterium]|nr:hypothetical protein [Bacteroidota bacterium]